ncbi:MAG TPA: hypothetical protein VF334_04075 [Polyangia bacterium]
MKNFDPSACEPPDEPLSARAPIPVPEVQFGLHFNLQQPLDIPSSPSQSWKLPRWVVTSVGLFFGSTAVLMIACCVVLLRDPKPAPAAPLVVPAPPVATTSAAVPVERPAVRPSSPAIANVARDDAAPAHRSVASRHPSVVRRQVYRARRVASKSTSSSSEPQETETASRRPAPDALDKLLSESSL